MGLATIGIGLIPSYETVGIISPSLLLFFRFIQSTAVAGEFNNSSIFLIERSKKRSWIGVASSSDMFTGILITYIVNTTSYEYAWRIEFISVGVISLILMFF
ncbi:hypothetical protein [Candidatus Photodesmus blepharus]|uniref:hypothetical protein n=1 Tax=Candidatus Photodesmus blepharonis TaxID=1179155 RepID=UPI000558A6C3|nr:hypothetical protein [Candidatus Photodesmus blepharus]